MAAMGSATRASATAPRALWRTENAMIRRIVSCAAASTAKHQTSKNTSQPGSSRVERVTRAVDTPCSAAGRQGVGPQLHLVAALAFGPVQCLVSAAHQQLGVDLVRAERGAAQAKGQRRRLGLHTALDRRQALDGVAQLLGHDADLF